MKKFAKLLAVCLAVMALAGCSLVTVNPEKITVATVGGETIENLIANNAGYIASYWLVIAMLAYILYYSLVGCKNVNKDIPVE